MDKPGTIGSGQALTFIVRDGENPGAPACVVKILDNPRDDRRARFL
jgi:hypothetical protein